MLSQTELHERILYPVVRVRGQTAGGSGVLVYSHEDSRDPRRFINLVLTCDHVVEDLISVREEWDAVLKRDVKRDHFSEATVEVFDYDGSRVISSNATRAQIVAYDKHHDLAMLRLLHPRQMPYVATVVPKGDIPSLRLFDLCWVSGCSLLHDPFASEGRLTYLREIIEGKTYLMQNAPSIFGNSGGGLFHGESGHLLGLTSRITGIQLGFGIDIMSWMGFSTHPDRIHEFLEHQELQCVVDSADDYHAGAERRERRRRESLREVLLGPDLPQPSEG